MGLDRRRLALNSEENMDIIRSGLITSRSPILVVDDFYEDPDYVRQMALNLDYYRRHDDGVVRALGVHPNGVKRIARVGVDQTEAYSFIHNHWAKAFIPGLGFFLEKVRHESIFSLMFRLNGGFDPALARPQFLNTLWTGVVFLNPAEQCNGGIGFYKHRTTGAEEVLSSDLILELEGEKPRFYKSTLDFVKGILSIKKTEAVGEGFYDRMYSFVRETPILKMRYMKGSDEHWEMTQFVDMKFNRLVCFPSFALHSHIYQDNWFGVTAEDSRLTQEFSYDWPEA